MTTYETITIEGLTNGELPHRCNPREEADLPKAVTGRGVIWQLPNRTTTGNTILASYHAYNDNDNEYQPIEFVNSQWHFIQWDDTDKFLGYWVFPNGNIPQGMFNLGWLGNILETQTPIARLSHFRERAESSSTQPEQEPPEQSSEGDNMDRNPALTEELAQTFVTAPVFEDITEAIETPQDRTHYLPTIVPPAHVIQPVRVNPPPL
jgi:hypothetical protein